MGKLTLDEHLDLPKCDHPDCPKNVHTNAQGITWKFCFEHRMDVFKDNVKEKKN